MNKRSLAYLLLFCVIPVCARDQVHNTLSENDLAFLSSHPEVPFVYLPKEIALSLAAMHATIPQSEATQSIRDVATWIQHRLSILPHELASAVIPEALRFYNAHRTEFSDEGAYNQQIDSLVAYKTALATNDASIALLKSRTDTKIACNLLIKRLETKTLAVNGSQTISGDLTVNGCVNTSCINNQKPFTTGSFPDTVFVVTDAQDASKQLTFDVQGKKATKTTITTNSSANRTVTVPDVDGTLLIAKAGTNEVLIGGQKNAMHGSKAGMQYVSQEPFRAQAAFMQYGKNKGIPGLATLKSRGKNVGDLAPVHPGDAISRVTATGVTGNGAVLPSAYISINVPKKGVPHDKNYIATEYELQLISVDGKKPRPVYKISSEGVPQLLEKSSDGPHTTVPSGIVTLNANGKIKVDNAMIPANARILLTVQPGSAPKGMVWVSDINQNTNFTISSTAGSQDAGLHVYYQIYIPLP